MTRLRNLFWLFLLMMGLAACGGGGETFTGDDVVAAFKAAGLEAEDPYIMTKDDYGLAPFVGTGTRFFLPSLCDDCGGRIIITDNNEDTEAIREYYVTLGETSAAFFSWVTVRDNVVLQMNGDLPEESFHQYETVLNGMD
ncbi:MAG: hypothetical protein KA314_04520 [Chloroflexi bacterium]|nr:hypothetical protein [Chloroflexota bacterium]